MSLNVTSSENVPESKRRKLPGFEDAEDETLLNRTAQNLAEQYIQHFPEHVGQLAARTGLGAARKAAESLHSATDGEAISSLRQSYRSWRESDHLLQPCDTIAVVSVDFNAQIGSEDIQDVIRYEVVQVSEIKEYVVNVFEEWLRHFLQRTSQDSIDTRETERNGSAMLNEDDQLSTLEDYIERVAADLTGQDAEGDNEGALESNVEWIHVLVKEFLDDPGFETFDARSTGHVALYQRVPKITLRYVRGLY